MPTLNLGMLTSKLCKPSLREPYFGVKIQTETVPDFVRPRDFCLFSADSADSDSRQEKSPANFASGAK